MYTKNEPLEELVREIEIRDSFKKDYIVSPGRLVADVENDRPIITYDGLGTSLQVSEVANQQIGNWSPVGTRYAREMMDQCPDLWCTNMNYWFNEKANTRNRMLRTVQGDTVPQLRAFLSSRYGRYEDIHLLQTVLEKVHDKDWKVLQCGITDRGMHVRVIFPKMQGEIVPGDEIGAGCSFINSEVGFRKWKTEFFTFQSYCMNGMIFGKQFVAGYHRKHITAEQPAGVMSASTLALDDTILRQEVINALDSMEDSKKFNMLLDGMRESTKVIPADVVGTSIKLAKNAGLTKDETCTLQTNYISGGDTTLWGLVNALTATARDIPSLERKTQLEQFAGNIVTTPSTWKGLTQLAA